MPKIPQRNVNLAAKYSRLAKNLLELSETLLTEQKISDLVLATLNNELLDTISMNREFNRKVSLIERTGNRG